MNVKSHSLTNIYSPSICRNGLYPSHPNLFEHLQSCQYICKVLTPIPYIRKINNKKHIFKAHIKEKTDKLKELYPVRFSSKFINNKNTE